MHSSRAFAYLSGLTSKSLRHYERVGLLVPMRTASGYRRYSAADLMRIHKTLALKSLGLPLKTIKSILGGQGIDLVAHRDRLAIERDRLTHAIDALTDLISQPNTHAAFDAFAAEFAWDRAEARRRQHASSTPRPPDRVCESRRVAFRELADALEVDPHSERTHLLAEVLRRTSDPDAAAAVKRRGSWPSGMRRYMASLYDASVDKWERVIRFVESLPPT